MRKIQPIINRSHGNKMKEFFKMWLKNYYHIDFFAIIVVLPNTDVLDFSSDLPFTKQYHKRGYGLFDNIFKPSIYENWPIYPWRCGKTSSILEKIHRFREEDWNLALGTHFVRKVVSENNEVFYLIYAIGTHYKDPLIQFKHICQVNQIMEIGDFAYNNFRVILQSYVTYYQLPIIKEFKPFTENDSKLPKDFSFSDNIKMSSSIKQQMKDEIEKKSKLTLINTPDLHYLE